MLQFIGSLGARLYPILLVKQDGSTIHIRYPEPRRMLTVSFLPRPPCQTQASPRPGLSLTCDLDSCWVTRVTSGDSDVEGCGAPPGSGGGGPEGK